MATKKPDDTKARSAFASYLSALAAIEDPKERFQAATEAEARWEAKERIVAIRDAAALEMSSSMSLAEIAKFGGFSRARAQQLVNRAKLRIPSRRRRTEEAS